MAIFRKVYTLYIQISKLPEYVLRKESEIMAIEFGMLQSIKAKGLAAKGANVNQIRQNVSKAQSIFDEYNNYKNQLVSAQDNGGATVSTTNVAFGSASVSADDIQSKMQELEKEFKKYYTAMNQQTEAKPKETQGESKEEKEKVQPKNFGGLMA